MNRLADIANTINDALKPRVNLGLSPTLEDVHLTSIVAGIMLFAEEQSGPGNNGTFKSSNAQEGWKLAQKLANHFATHHPELALPAALNFLTRDKNRDSVEAETIKGLTNQWMTVLCLQMIASQPLLLARLPYELTNPPTRLESFKTLMNDSLDFSLPDFSSERYSNLALSDPKILRKILAVLISQGIADQGGKLTGLQKRGDVELRIPSTQLWISHFPPVFHLWRPSTQLLPNSERILPLTSSDPGVRMNTACDLLWQSPTRIRPGQTNTTNFTPRVKEILQGVVGPDLSPVPLGFSDFVTARCRTLQWLDRVISNQGNQQNIPVPADITIPTEFLPSVFEEARSVWAMISNYAPKLTHLKLGKLQEHGSRLLYNPLPNNFRQCYPNDPALLDLGDLASNHTLPGTLKLPYELSGERNIGLLKLSICVTLALVPDLDGIELAVAAAGKRYTTINASPTPDFTTEELAEIRRKYPRRSSPPP